jgi:hypothetical protein
MEEVDVEVMKAYNDAPQNSLIDSTMSSNVKTTKG